MNKLDYYRAKLAKVINTDDDIAILGYASIVEEETLKLERQLAIVLAEVFPDRFRQEGSNE